MLNEKEMKLNKVMFIIGTGLFVVTCVACLSMVVLIIMFGTKFTYDHAEAQRILHIILNR